MRQLARKPVNRLSEERNVLKYMGRISEVPYRSPLDETAAVVMGNQSRIGTEEAVLEQQIETGS